MKTDTVLTDRYQIKKLLSQKAGRRTYLASDLKSQVPVIIKLLRFGDGFEWEDLKLFEREAATLKNLDHPEIPEYLDYFEVDDIDTPGFALVQSYIEAPSLATLIARGYKFSEVEIIELADRLLDLLTYLHQQHPPVIHRDIKPSNILLRNRSGNSIGDVYLIDFGSVQIAEKKEGTITIVGTYGYMPLEQFGGQTTTASDLYSLGMTLIYLLTGTHPIDLPLVDGRVKFNSEISTRFEQWLEKMTHPHLDKRFESAKMAQLALKSKDGSYGNFDQLKPTYTQIQIYRDCNKFEIVWHEENKNFFPLLLVLVGLFVMVLCGLWVLACFFVVLTPKSLFQKLRYRYKVKNHLIIDDRQIYQLKDRTQGRKPIKLSEHLRSQIEILAFNPAYTFDKCVDQSGNLIPGGTINIPQKLYLYCGNFEYSLPAKSSSAEFSHAELWWLGDELSKFLDIDLQVIYPTPKVPPAASCGGGC